VRFTIYLVFNLLALAASISIALLPNDPGWQRFGLISAVAYGVLLGFGGAILIVQVANK
jgi:hypothetical protein